MTESRYVRTAIAVLIGVSGAVLGLLPWLVTGLQLPVQNIWARPAAPDEMPFALLPLSQYYVVQVAAMVVVGSALAGIATRLPAVRALSLKPWVVATGAAAVQTVALVQSAQVLRAGIELSQRGELYVDGIVVGVGASIIAGVLVLLGIVRGHTAALTVSLTFAALALAQWILTLVAPFGEAWAHSTPYAVARTASALSLWLPSLAVGVLIGWCGASTVRRFMASFTSLVALWVVPAMVSTVMHTLGSRVLLQDPAHIVDAAARTFIDSLTAYGAPQRIFIALAIAVVVAITLRSVRGGLPR